MPAVNRYVLSVHHSEPRTCTGESGEWQSWQSVLQELTHQQERPLAPPPTLGEIFMLPHVPLYPVNGMGIDGISTQVSWLWGRGVERKGTEWPHDALLTMVICHLSIRSLNLAYGPKLLSPSPTAQEVLGQPLATCWGILTLALAVCLKRPSRLSWEAPVPYCLLLCAQVCSGCTWKPVRPFYLSHQLRPDCCRPAQRTTGGQVYTEMKQPN